MNKDILLSCIKQFPLNFAPIFPLYTKVSFGAKLLSDVTGVLILSSDNPLHFHAKSLSVSVDV